MEQTDLLAVRAIEQLKYRYLRALDSKDWDLLRSTFTADATANYGDRLEFSNPDDLVAFMRENLGPDMVTLHQVHHPEIDVAGDSATGRWSLQDRIVMTGYRLLLDGASLYEDRYSRGADGEWRISHTGYVRLYEHTVAMDDLPSFALTHNHFAE